MVTSGMLVHFVIAIKTPGIGLHLEPLTRTYLLVRQHPFTNCISVGYCVTRSSFKLQFALVLSGNSRATSFSVLSTASAQISFRIEALEPVEESAALSSKNSFYSSN